MKRWGCIIPLLILVALLLVFALGPRVAIDTTIDSVTLPADLDAYLAESEAQFDDIVPGTEKTIIWADPDTKAKTDVALVYLHGFSATRQETAPLSDLVAAELDANLYYTRLTGHGRDGEAMTEATVNAWLNDTAEAIAIGRAIGDKVVLVAVSNGGPLALWYAASEYAGDDLAAIVLMSPNLGPRDQTSEVLLWPWAKQIINLVMGPERGWDGDNAEHERFWTNRYPSAALLPMMGAVKLGREADLTAIEAPMLVIYSLQDEVVNTDKVEAMFKALKRDDVVLLPVEDSADSSNHVLAGDILSPNTTERLVAAISDFVTNALAQD